MDMSITALLFALGFCAICIAVGFLIQWGLRWLGCPAEPMKWIMIIVWIIIGLACIARMLRLIGMA